MNNTTDIIDPVDNEDADHNFTAETPDERFIRIGTRRLNNAVKQIRLLGNLSNRSLYGDNPERVAKMLEILRKEINDLEKAFDRTKQSNDPSYSL